MNHRPALVVGIGNPLRGDDAAGAEVVRRVAPRAPDEAVCESVHQLLPEHAALLAKARVAVFVDASAHGVPGSVTVQQLREQDAEAEAAFTHELDPAGIAVAARALYGAAPPCWLVTIAGASFEMAEGLSAPVRGAIDRAVEKVLDLISS